MSLFTITLFSFHQTRTTDCGIRTLHLDLFLATVHPLGKACQGTIVASVAIRPTKLDVVRVGQELEDIAKQLLAVVAVQPHDKDVQLMFVDHAQHGWHEVGEELTLVDRDHVDFARKPFETFVERPQLVQLDRGGTIAVVRVNIVAIPSVQRMVEYQHALSDRFETTDPSDQFCSLTTIHTSYNEF